MPRSQVFNTVYKHTRRKHRHRCRHCARILTEGEPVVMVLLGRRSFVVHEDCDDRHPDGITWTQAFRAWAGEPINP